MICLKCNKSGFNEREVWYPHNMQSVLKCNRCGERSDLGEWLVMVPVQYHTVELFAGEVIPVRMPE